MNAQPKNKRVVFTMGGTGGVGKTGLIVALAEWFEANEIPFTLLDLDTENKARGSLKHFFARVRLLRDHAVRSLLRARGVSPPPRRPYEK